MLIGATFKVTSNIFKPRYDLLSYLLACDNLLILSEIFSLFVIVVRHDNFDIAKHWKEAKWVAFTLRFGLGLVYSNDRIFRIYILFMSFEMNTLIFIYFYQK
jgi:hypothetical protein